MQAFSPINFGFWSNANNQRERKAIGKKLCFKSCFVIQKLYSFWFASYNLNKDGVKFFYFVFNCTTLFKIVQIKYIVINWQLDKSAIVWRKSIIFRTILSNSFDDFHLYQQLWWFPSILIYQFITIQFISTIIIPKVYEVSCFFVNHYFYFGAPHSFLLSQKLFSFESLIPYE